MHHSIDHATDAPIAPAASSAERRQAARVPVAAIAVMHSATQPPSIWRVTNLSLGGVGLVGNAALVAGRHRVTLHVAGFPALDLHIAVLRSQLVSHGRRCGARFVDLTRDQREALAAITAADHGPVQIARRVQVVVPSGGRAQHLCTELGRLGYSARHEVSSGQALAWLQREESEALIVDETVLAADRWSLLQFVRDTAPDVRRFVIASDVRGFRLYYAIKAGMVEALIEPSAAGDSLARHFRTAPGAV